MSVQTPVDKTSPLWKAWEAYKVTEHYANTKKWAATSHVEGSLWAAFERGFAAAAVERGVREIMDADVERGLVAAGWGAEDAAEMVQKGMPSAKTVRAALESFIRERGVREPSEVRELLCMSCDREYQVWFATNDLWNRVVRRADGSDEWPFLCPTCFMNIAADRKIATAFELRVAERGVRETPKRKHLDHCPAHPDIAMCICDFVKSESTRSGRRPSDGGEDG